MKRLLSFLLAVLCMMTLIACPAPTPTPAPGSSTTTTTAGSGSGSGSGSGGTGNKPTAPLALSASSPYYLVGDRMTFTVTGNVGDELTPVFPEGSVTDVSLSGTTLTATAAQAGEFEIRVTEGTRTVTTTVTVFDAAERTISPTDPLIRILGRTEQNADGEILLNNTASGFEITFFGKALSVGMYNGAGKPDTAKLAVYIDGEGDPAVDQIDLSASGVDNGGVRVITLASFETAGLHTVRVQKITQEALATAVFSSVTVTGGLLETEADEALRLLIYGDSITCGHSNMREDGTADKNNSTNENGMLTYAMRAAAMLGADAHVFAKSGLGLYTDPYAATTHLKEIYGKVSPESKTDWDMTSWVPDAVVINIGTNDIWATSGSPGDPPYSKEGFVEAYVTMVRELVDIWGDGTTFFLCSSMMASNLGAHVQEAVTRLINEDGIAVYYVDLPHQQNSGGHPTNPSHAAAADVLYRAIADKMGY